MKTITTNLNNWTGEEATVAYNEKGEFEFYGYKFRVGPFTPFQSDILVGGTRELNGSDWDDVLTAVATDTDSIGEAVMAAVRWIANHI